MKSVILAGASRSGKTTFARVLQKETGFSLISGDALICAFMAAYPELKVGFDDDFNTACYNWEKFITTYLKHSDQYQNAPFIFDTVNLLPEQVSRLKLDKIYQVIFFGYPELTPEEKFQHIRLYQTEHYDWVTERSDKALMEHVTIHIERSKKFEQECVALGLHFVNTGKNFPMALEKARNLIS